MPDRPTRQTGILQRWNVDGGYGFIAPTQGGREIFVHVSALPRDGTRPVEGETLSYEIGPGREGRPQALNVHRQAFGPPDPVTSRAVKPSRRTGSIVGTLASLVFLAVAGAYVYQRLVLHGAASRVDGRTPSVSTLIEQRPAYRCDGRTYCSQMTSCTEATFFLQHCPNTKMDGDHDGVPCESQWCPGR